ncbi:MAG: CblZ, a non-orthologous displasment for Alpha-ribazole-5'-phosphate phosphatase [uncultured Nocardioides sp.]|uniref:CblZ, a non-orthologous displasment for Alpha-ribazole-5'-phosphate phosphatase n=1 Tax=uncultured Nocardioides sp. TaxID=198441 RepID=A0A6J4NEG2_9ACTN|nr:MAG: CblZ, a non-orthologous displasment for Alpha-ribazole-5'-phosphate phosphatase [uncultured Nocardioides sp.]
MFRRRESAPEIQASPAEVSERPGAKGRPTPTRKEAEAAARARAKVPRTRKEQMAAQRAARGESSARMREAMKTGDERYLPPRDRGPVRRFIRDFVDSRLTLIELMVPILIISMVLGYSGNATAARASNTLLLATLVMIVIDALLLRSRLRRELARRFPDESRKGTTLYAVMRSMQMRFMRLPKAQTRIGQPLPEHYR